MPAWPPRARTVWSLEQDRKSRRRLVLLVTPIVVLTIMGFAASAFTPALAARHPLLLILLDARGRNLVLARHVDFLPLFFVAIFRRLLSDPLYYLLGRYHGDAALRWLEKAGLGPLVSLAEKYFPRASYPMVFLFPGGIVCALAGATRMSLKWFITLNVAGTITAVLTFRAFGDVLGDPVDSLLGFFNRYLWQTTSVTIGLVILSIVLGRVQGKSEIPSIDDLEAEIEREGLADDGSERASEGEEPPARGIEPTPEAEH